MSLKRLSWIVLSAALSSAVLGGVPAVRAWREGDRVATSRRIMFKNGLVQFTDDSKVIVDAVAGALRAEKDVDIVVEGHTDAGGDEQENLRLSQGRADEVKRALVRRGIPAERLTSVGRGSSLPLVAAGHPEQYRNRRVEFVLVRRAVVAPSPNLLVDAPPLAPLLDDGAEIASWTVPLLEDTEPPVRFAFLHDDAPSPNIPLLDDTDDLLGLSFAASDDELLPPSQAIGLLE